MKTLRGLTARVVLSTALSLGTPVAPVIPLVALTSTVVITQGCDKESALKNSRRANSVLREVVPIFQANGLSTVRLQEAITLSDRLIVALETGGTGSDPVALVSALISTFNALVSEDVLKIQNPQTKTIILVSLAIANIALREIANALAEEAPPTARSSRDANVIESFRASPKWRCRDSVSGQFRKMDYCKANPSTSTVETQ